MNAPHEKAENDPAQSKEHLAQITAYLHRRMELEDLRKECNGTEQRVSALQQEIRGQKAHLESLRNQIVSGEEQHRVGEADILRRSGEYLHECGLPPDAIAVIMQKFTEGDAHALVSAICMQSRTNLMNTGSGKENEDSFPLLLPHQHAQLLHVSHAVHTYTDTLGKPRWEQEKPHFDTMSRLPFAAGIAHELLPPASSKATDLLLAVPGKIDRSVRERVDSLVQLVDRTHEQYLGSIPEEKLSLDSFQIRYLAPQRDSEEILRIEGQSFDQPWL